MAKIKINELPQDIKITKEEMKKVFGGFIYTQPAINESFSTDLGTRVIKIDSPAIMGTQMLKI